MTVTLNLPPNIELAFMGEAASRGLTPDELISEVLLAHAAHQQGSLAGTESPSAILRMKNGVPVLRTGHAMALDAIDDTVELVRRERDLSNFESF